MAGINGFISSSMDKLKDLVDVDTVVGKPIKIDGETILPISKVTFGFGGGGSEFETKAQRQDSPFGGGLGGGFTITPIAFLIIGPGGVELKHLEEKTHIYERLMEQVPKTIHSLIEEFDRRE